MKSQRAPVNCPECGLEPFAYEDVPLEIKGFSVRLVRLHPASVTSADIVFELITTNDPNTAYDALSWCWGPDLWTKSVRARTTTGDRCLKVSPNLENALRHLRSRETYRYLWIDALCIDQSSPVEKSRQVPQMSKIYGKARRVCVWIGKHDDKSRQAMKFITEHMLNLQRFDQLCAAKEHHANWIALIEFLERPWFSRRWVIQEIALANHKTATVHCGNDWLTWAEFAEAVSLFESALAGPLDLKGILSNVPEDVTYRSRYMPALGARQLVKATNSLFRKSFYYGDPLPLKSLEELVSSFWMYETSQPRDVIYALLSISKDAFRLDTAQEDDDDELVEVPKTIFDSLPTARRLVLSWMNRHKTRQAFKVDYQASIVDVYRQFIAFSFSKSDKSRALDIICRPWAPELPDHNLPSWICTLANSAYKLEHQRGIGQRLIRRNPDPLVGMPDQFMYSASGNVGPQHEINIFKYWDRDGRSMFLRGFVLDEVGTVLPYSQLGNIPVEWLDLAEWDPRKPGPPPEPFWRTLVADRGPEGQKDPLAFYPRACKFVFRHAIDDTLDTGMFIEQGSSIIQDFLKRVQAVIWNRKLMRTRRSNWLGLVPKGAKPGDLICILYGCSVPVVLRKIRKSPSDLSAELRDEKERQKDAASYIARLWRANTQRRREVRERYERILKEQYQQQQAMVSATGDQFNGGHHGHHHGHHHSHSSLFGAGHGHVHGGYFRKSPYPLPPIESFTTGHPAEPGLLSSTPTRQYSHTFASPRVVNDPDFGYTSERDKELGTNDDVMYADFAYPSAVGMSRVVSNGPLFPGPNTGTMYSSSTFGGEYGGVALSRVPTNPIPAAELNAAPPMMRSISGTSTAVAMSSGPVGSMSNGSMINTGTAMPGSLPSSGAGSMAEDSRRGMSGLPPLAMALAGKEPYPRMSSPTQLYSAPQPLPTPPALHPTPPNITTPKRRLTAEFPPDGHPSAKRISPGVTATGTPKVNGGLVDANQKEFYYKLVGESYVHGMMNGEAVAFRTRYNSGMTLDGKIMVEKFELR
jgi:hypothetical protein